MAISVCVGLVALRGGRTDAKTYDFSDSGFSLEAPADWQPIPNALLAEHNREVFAKSGLQEPFQYGFQLATNREWFALPYLLVQVRTNGGLSAAEIRSISFPWSESVSRADSIPSSNRLAVLLSNVPANQMVYDSQEHWLWSHTVKGMTNLGAISGLNGFRLTRQGMIRFSGYAYMEDFERFAPVFDQMIRSVQLAPGQRYQPTIGVSWVDRLYPSRVVLLPLGLGSLGLLALLIFWLWNRRHDADDSPG